MDGQYGAPLPLSAPQSNQGLNAHLLQALSLLNSTSGAALTYQTQALDSAQAPQALDSAQALVNDVNINNVSEFLSDIPSPKNKKRGRPKNSNPKNSNPKSPHPKKKKKY